jgi:nicotinamidase/pyrazinamidase
MKKVLIVVDVQRDFCEGGALAANDTRSLLNPLQKYIEAVRQREDLVVFSQDWHPVNHKSFKQNGGPWPVHCVAGSRGAELMPPLKPISSDVIIHKGVSCDADGYSAFAATGLSKRLDSLGIQSLAVCGIATEYCVRATALDAAKAKYQVTLLRDLVRAVNNSDALIALDKITDAGVKLLDARDWLKS